VPAEYGVVDRPALIVVAFREDSPSDVEALLPCLVSLRATAPEAQVLVVEDRAPGGPSLAEAAAEELGLVYVDQDDGAGLVAAANAGLEVARANGLDAVLVGPDVELLHAGWLARMQARTDTQGRPAAVVGGRLLHSDGLIAHAGFYFSVLRQRWLDRFMGVPGEVPESHAPTLCPVSARLQLLRNDTLHAVGLPDPELDAPFADLDHCLRVFDAGLECVYEPAAAGRRPGVAKGQQRDDSEPEVAGRLALDARHSRASFNRFIPDVV
jgi:GT2 family glycosyltransferase